MGKQINICEITVFVWILVFSFFCAISSTDVQAGDNAGRNLTLQTGYVGNNIVYLTEKGQEPIKNDLTFYIKSMKNKPGEESGPIAAEANKSYIKIFFEYGDGLGDLAGTKDVVHYEFSLLRNYGNEFEIKKFPDGVRPYWKLTAQSDVFFKGETNNRIELKFSNVFSYLAPGLTILHVEYGDIPDYSDGYVSLDIVKENPQKTQVKYGLYVGDQNADPGRNNLLVDGGVTLQYGGSVNEFSVDSSMSGNSDRKLPTEKAVKTYVDNRLPPGVIVMWSGDVDKVPEGWALCDGNNGTPDLRNVFILGYGKRALHETGGQESVVLTVDQMPEHSHTGNTNFSFNEPTFVTEKIYHAWNSNRKYANGVQSVAKTSRVNLYPSGKGQAHDNMPPFYVLAYIMKLPDSSVSQ